MAEERTQATDGGAAAAKRALRRDLRRRRAALPADDRAAKSSRIAGRLATMPQVAKARTVFLFSSFGSEVSTDEITGWFRGRDVRVFLPIIEDGRMEAIEVGPDDPLVRSRYGALEPARRVAADPLVIDLVIAPGLGFDRRGGRIGYGAGYYDGYLRRLREDVLTVAIAFHEQLVDKVPVGDRDVLVDAIVTDQELVWCRPPA